VFFFVVKVQDKKVDPRQENDGMGKEEKCTDCSVLNEKVVRRSRGDIKKMSMGGGGHVADLGNDDRCF
jgi:hypothetical protein